MAGKGGTGIRRGDAEIPGPNPAADEPEEGAGGWRLRPDPFQSSGSQKPRGCFRPRGFFFPPANLTELRGERWWPRRHGELRLRGRQFCRGCPAALLAVSPIALSSRRCDCHHRGAAHSASCHRARSAIRQSSYRKEVSAPGVLRSDRDTTSRLSWALVLPAQRGLDASPIVRLTNPPAGCARDCRWSKLFSEALRLRLGRSAELTQRSFAREWRRPQQARISGSQA